MRLFAVLLVAVFSASLTAQKIEIDDLVDRVARGEAGDARMRRRIAAYIAIDPRAAAAADRLTKDGAGREAVETALWIRRMRLDPKKGVPAFLFAALEHPVWTVRVEAWYAAIGVDGVPESAIQKGLEDALAPVRSAALNYLGMRPELLSLPLRPFVRRRVEDPHPDVADLAAGLLAVLEDPEPLDHATLASAAFRGKLGRRAMRIFLSAICQRSIDDPAAAAFVRDLEPERGADATLLPLLAELAQSLDRRSGVAIAKAFANASDYPWSQEAIAALEAILSDTPDFGFLLAKTIGGVLGTELRRLAENPDGALPQRTVRRRLARPLLFGRAPYEVFGDLLRAWPASAKSSVVKVAVEHFVRSNHPEADRWLKHWMEFDPKEALLAAQELSPILVGDLAAYVDAALIERGDERVIERRIDDARVGRRSTAALLGFRKIPAKAWRTIAESALLGESPEVVRATAVRALIAERDFESLKRFFDRELALHSVAPPGDSFWIAAEALHGNGDDAVERALLERLDRLKGRSEEQKVLLALEARVTPNVRRSAREILDAFAFAERDMPTLLRLAFDATDDQGRGQVVMRILLALNRSKKTATAPPNLPWERLNGYMLADVFSRSHIDAAAAGQALVAMIERRVVPVDPMLAVLDTASKKSGFGEIFLRSIREFVVQRASKMPDEVDWAFIGFLARLGDPAAVARVREIFASTIEEISATQRYDDPDLNQRFDAAVTALLETEGTAAVSAVFEAMLVVDAERGIRQLTSIGASEERDDEDDYRALWQFVFGAVAGKGRAAIEEGLRTASRAAQERCAFIPDFPEICGRWIMSSTSRSSAYLPIVGLALIEVSTPPGLRRIRPHLDFRLARNLWATGEPASTEIADRLAATLGRRHFDGPRRDGGGDRAVMDMLPSTAPDFDAPTPKDRALWRSFELGRMSPEFARDLPLRWVADYPGRWLTIFDESGWFERKESEQKVGAIIETFADLSEVSGFVARRMAERAEWSRLLHYTRDFFADLGPLDDSVQTTLDYFSAVAAWNLGDHAGAECALAEIAPRSPDLDRDGGRFFSGYADSAVMKAIVDGRR